MVEPNSNSPWDVESLYKFQYFNCPTCSYKNNVKQDFIDHAVNSHPESKKYFINILNHESFSDVIIAIEFEAEELNIESEQLSIESEQLNIESEQPNIQTMKTEVSENEEGTADQIEKASSSEDNDPLDFQNNVNIKIEANFDSNIEIDTLDNLQEIIENDSLGVSKKSKRTPKPKKQFPIEKYGKVTQTMYGFIV